MSNKPKDRTLKLKKQRAQKREVSDEELDYFPAPRKGKYRRHRQANKRSTPEDFVQECGTDSDSFEPPTS